MCFMWHDGVNRVFNAGTFIADPANLTGRRTAFAVLIHKWTVGDARLLIYTAIYEDVSCSRLTNVEHEITRFRRSESCFTELPVFGIQLVRLSNS